MTNKPTGKIDTAYYTPGTPGMPTFRGILLVRTEGSSKIIRSIAYGNSDDRPWGYCGSGPLDTATRMIADATEKNPKGAVAIHFMRDVISKLRSPKWRIKRSFVRRWFDRWCADQVPEQAAETVKSSKDTVAVVSDFANPVPSFTDTPRSGKSTQAIGEDVLYEVGGPWLYVTERSPKGTTSTPLALCMNRGSEEVVESIANHAMRAGLPVSTNRAETVAVVRELVSACAGPVSISRAAIIDALRKSARAASATTEATTYHHIYVPAQTLRSPFVATAAVSTTYRHIHIYAPKKACKCCGVEAKGVILRATVVAATSTKMPEPIVAAIAIHNPEDGEPSERAGRREASRRLRGARILGLSLPILNISVLGRGVMMFEDQSAWNEFTNKMLQLTSRSRAEIDRELQQIYRGVY